MKSHYIGMNEGSENMCRSARKGNKLLA